MKPAPREFLVEPSKIMRCPERSRCWAELKSEVVFDGRVPVGHRIVGYWCSCTFAVENGRPDP